MSDAKRFKVLCLCAAACVAALVITSCEIRLRGDDDRVGSSSSLTQHSVSTVEKLEQRRTVEYEQTDADLECQKFWAGQRGQFTGEMRVPPLGLESGRSSSGSSAPVPRKDESRLPSSDPAMAAQSE